jgi:hypothetical protein
LSRRSVPPPVRLVLSAIYRDEERLADALPRVVAAVGPVRPAGERFPFDWTRYYEKEMGAPLFRRFHVALRPVARDSLPGIKIRMEAIEGELAEGGRRTVNLDPGLLSAESFLLATGKNFSHRVYLGEGVFADLTLVYRKGEFRPLPWTYPDYASDGVRALLRDLRREHLAGAPEEVAQPCG